MVRSPVENELSIGKNGDTEMTQSPIKQQLAADTELIRREFHGGISLR